MAPIRARCPGRAIHLPAAHDLPEGPGVGSSHSAARSSAAGDRRFPRLMERVRPMSVLPLPVSHEAPSALEGSERLPAVYVLDRDDDLGRLLDPSRMAMARRRLRAPLISLTPGRWVPPSAMAGTSVLALDGLLVREVVVADEVAAEIVGPGDVVPVLGDEQRMLPASVRWSAIAPAQLAVLGSRFARTLLAFPEVTLTLMERQRERTERLLSLQAAARLKGAECKVLALLWLLADRWGRMTRDGVVLPIALQHTVMANLVGARRPTVSSAIGRLQRRGALLRRADGGWLLRERPDDVRSALLDREAGAADTSARPQAGAERRGLPARRDAGDVATAGLDDASHPARPVQLERRAEPARPEWETARRELAPASDAAARSCGASVDAARSAGAFAVRSQQSHDRT